MSGIFVLERKLGRRIGYMKDLSLVYQVIRPRYDSHPGLNELHAIA
uniref:Uncharacterized protein n=1 Tax=Anguilla anguilla TaxID=7936 RepID=A0A0E9W2H4_ANGAN